MVHHYYNELVIEGGCLYKPEPEGLGIVKKGTYCSNVSRGRYRVVRRGGGAGRPALVAWASLPQKLQKQIETKIGVPEKVVRDNALKQHLNLDQTAVEYYEKYRMHDGRSLPEKAQRQYVAEASIFNAITALIKGTLEVNGKLSRLWKNIPPAVADLSKRDWPHALPGNEQRLRRKYKQFIKTEHPDLYERIGYDSLVHKGYCNENSTKIKGDVGDWWIVQYAQPNKPMIPALMMEYDGIRKQKKWPRLSNQAVSRFLNQTDIKMIWFAGRHGEEHFRNEFGHHVKRKRDNWFTNAYWAIDGSKLDWVHYYDNAQGVAAKLKIDPVFDVFSEKIIGWSLSESESHLDHFRALKMAAQHAGCRPYLLTYDKQGGHKKGGMSKLYDKLVAKNKGTHYSHRSRAHNSPAEGLFSRFQQQVLNQLWFSDKQSPLSRSQDSKPNMDFLLANKHLLKSKEELITAWKYCVEKWNNAKHPRYAKTRAEIYALPAPVREELTITDQIELFWVMTEREITYRKGGLMMKIGKQSYEYEVLDGNGNIDIEFRRNYLKQKFFVRYDPEFLSDYIQLLQRDHNGDLTVVAQAEPKRAHEVIPFLMADGDKAAWERDYVVRDQEYNWAKGELNKLREKTGITPSKLIEDQELTIKLGGQLPKKDREESEAHMAIMGF